MNSRELLAKTHIDERKVHPHEFVDNVEISADDGQSHASGQHDFGNVPHFANKIPKDVQVAFPDRDVDVDVLYVLNGESPKPVKVSPRTLTANIGA